MASSLASSLHLGLGWCCSGILVGPLQIHTSDPSTVALLAGRPAIVTVRVGSCPGGWVRAGQGLSDQGGSPRSVAIDSMRLCCCQRIFLAQSCFCLPGVGPGVWRGPHCGLSWLCRWRHATPISCQALEASIRVQACSWSRMMWARSGGTAASRLSACLLMALKAPVMARRHRCCTCSRGSPIQCYVAGRPQSYYVETWRRVHIPPEGLYHTFLPP